MYVTDDNVRAFGDCLKWCAANRIAYHIAYHIKESADLDAVAETVHHDGVCFIARLKKPVTLDEVVARVGRARTERAIVVLLADVKNPHNLGAILRVCAHFGVAGVLAVRDTPALSPAAMRTAAGGAEHVDVVPVDDVADAIDRLKRAGLSVVATSSHTEHAFGQGTLPSRALVMFGSEGEGLSRELLEQADIVIAIPGSGALESLNVACAASVVLWELWRADAGAGARASAPNCSAPRPPRELGDDAPAPSRERDDRAPSRDRDDRAPSRDRDDRAPSRERTSGGRASPRARDGARDGARARVHATTHATARATTAHGPAPAHATTAHRHAIACATSTLHRERESATNARRTTTARPRAPRVPHARKPPGPTTPGAHAPRVTMRAARAAPGRLRRGARRRGRLAGSAARLADPSFLWHSLAGARHALTPVARARRRVRSLLVQLV